MSSIQESDRFRLGCIEYPEIGPPLPDVLNTSSLSNSLSMTPAAPVGYLRLYTIGFAGPGRAQTSYARTAFAEVQNLLFLGVGLEIADL